MTAHWAYFDETIVVSQNEAAKNARQEMLVGGCIASQTGWDGFAVDWRAALRKEGIKTFHAKDFFSFRGEFRWLIDSGERDNRRPSSFRDELVDIIVGYVDEVVAFTSMVAVQGKGGKGCVPRRSKTLNP
jgi:hypothetical protein